METQTYLICPPKHWTRVEGTWKWKYDAQGNVIERINPLGAKSKLHYEDGLLCSITDSLGNCTEFNYNSQYDTDLIKDTKGNQTSYQYDLLGRCIKVISPTGQTQHKQYDLLGRIIQVDDFNSNHIEFTYDGINNLLHYKDIKQEVHYRYKGMWKMTYRQDNKGSTLYRYDTEEQLTEIINENKDSYRFKLNEVGEVVSETQFDEQTKYYERDLAGRVVTLTKPNGKKTSYGYDSVGRVISVDHNGKRSQQFTYNQAGQLVKATNPQSEIIFTRNILGATIKEEVNGHHIINKYNSIGQRTNLQSSLGVNIQYHHDEFGRLANLTANNQHGEWQSEYTYNDLGFELSRMLPGRLTQKFTYDRLGRLTQQETLQAKKQRRQRKYTWGTNDQLQQIDDSQHGKTNFSYTQTGHLEKSWNKENNFLQLRKADKVGNLYEAEDLKDRIYSDGGRLEKKGSWRYKYDSEGFLIQKYKGSGGLFGSKSNVWRYKWNDEGMLQTVIRPDNEEVHFTYDTFGRRLSKTFRSTTTKWLWDGNVPLHEWKENAKGEILSKTSVDKDGIITWVFEENRFTPIAKLRGDQQFSILADHLGTPNQMFDEVGKQVWERELDSFGRLKSGNHNSCPFMYQGQYYDEEIELAYNRFRYYAPEEGRYISKDPIGLASGEYGLYNYVPNPNGFIDILGFIAKPEKGTAYLIKTVHPEHGVHYRPMFSDGNVYDLNKDGTVISMKTKQKLSQINAPQDGSMEVIKFEVNEKDRTKKVNKVISNYVDPETAKKGTYLKNTKDCFSFSVDAINALRKPNQHLSKTDGDENPERYKKLKKSPYAK